MTEQKAKTQLRRMLRSFTPGSVLALLADVCREDAEQARRRGDDLARQRLRHAEAALIVVGLGLDATLPR